MRLTAVHVISAMAVTTSKCLFLEIMGIIWASTVRTDASSVRFSPSEPFHLVLQLLVT